MTSLFISILFFGSLMRICERPLEVVEDANTNNHFGFYENSFWFTMVTLTTGKIKNEEKFFIYRLKSDLEISFPKHC